jgi:hypothetical protein
MDRLKPIFGRDCIGCWACCETLAIEELCKPYYCRCENQMWAGCGVYGNHPRSCQTFECLWRLGFYDGERPDRFGYLLVPGIDYSTGNPTAYLDVYETTQDVGNLGDLDKAVNQALLKCYVQGIRLHNYGAKIGIGWNVSPKYTTKNYTNNGNYYVQDPNQPGLYHHVPEETGKQIIEKRGG